MSLLSNKLWEIAKLVLETAMEIQASEKQSVELFKKQGENDNAEIVGWIDKRTMHLSWKEGKLLVSNPEYIENNGPENFLPLVIKKE